MSDSEHGTGAHEIDNMPNGRLFNLLFGLSALTLLACIGVVQLFNRQLERIEDQRGEVASFQLSEYREEMGKLKGSWGVVEIVEDDGLPKADNAPANAGPELAPRYHMPLAEAKRRVLADPKVMAAQPEYPDWKVQVWDKKPANTETEAAAAPTPTPTMPPPTPQPAGRPTPTPNDGGAPAEGKAPAQPSPPADGKAPAQPSRPVDGKAPAKPTEGKAPAKPVEGKAEGKAPAKPAKPAEGKAEGKAE
jgi:hypothetical protein